MRRTSKACACTQGENCILPLGNPIAFDENHPWFSPFGRMASKFVPDEFIMSPENANFAFSGVMSICVIKTSCIWLNIDFLFLYLRCMLECSAECTWSETASHVLVSTTNESTVGANKLCLIEMVMRKQKLHR